jgi:hypothetical protein
MLHRALIFVFLNIIFVLFFLFSKHLYISLIYGATIFQCSTTRLPINEFGYFLPILQPGQTALEYAIAFFIIAVFPFKKQDLLTSILRFSENVKNITETVEKVQFSLYSSAAYIVAHK